MLEWRRHTFRLATLRKDAHNLASLLQATHMLLFRRPVIHQWGILNLVILDTVCILLQRIQARRNITGTSMLAIRLSSLQQQSVIQVHPWI